jgi:putative inorganic carbon (HCO3(-)) transporter
MQKSVAATMRSDDEQTLISCVLIALVLSSLLVAAIWPGLPFTITLSFVVAVFSYFQVDQFLYIVIFLLPLSPVIATGLPLHNISSIVHFSMFAGFVLNQVAAGRSLREWFFGEPLNRWSMVFVGAVLLCSFVFHSPTTSSLRACSELVAGLCFFLTIGSWVRTEAQAKKIFYAILVSGIGVAFIGFYQRIINAYGDFYFWLYPRQAEVLDPWTGRITSVLNYSNSLAGFLNLILPISLGLILIPISTRLRTAAIIALAGCTAALVLTASRGGFASFLAVLVLGAVYVARQAKSRRWLLIGGLVTSVLALVLFFGLVRTPWVEEDQPAAMRLLFWGFAATLFIRSPIVGVGYGNFRDLYNLPGIAPGVFDVHNLYLQLLSETGLLGFLSFTFLAVVAIKQCARHLKRRESNLRTIVNFAALGAVVALLLHGFVDFLFIVSPQFTALFWLILALVVVADRWPDRSMRHALQGIEVAR